MLADVLERVESDTSDFYNFSAEAPLDGIQPSSGGIGSKSKYAYDPAGQTVSYSVQPPVANMLFSGDDNLYTMDEADRIVGGQLSLPGGDRLASRPWRGGASHDDYIANALGSEPSSGMGTGGGAGMMGGYGGMGRYGRGGEMGGHGGMGGYGGGGYGFAAPTGAKRANEIESSGDLRRRREGIDEGAPAIAKPEYGRSIARSDSGAVDHHPFDAEMNHLVDCVREDRESHVNIADAYRTHEVCMAIDRSIAQGGQPVKLPLDG